MIGRSHLVTQPVVLTAPLIASSGKMKETSPLHISRAWNEGPHIDCSHWPCSQLTDILNTIINNHLWLYWASCSISILVLVDEYETWTRRGEKTFQDEQSRTPRLITCCSSRWCIYLEYPKNGYLDYLDHKCSCLNGICQCYRQNSLGHAPSTRTSAAWMLRSLLMPRAEWVPADGGDLSAQDWTPAQHHTVDSVFQGALWVTNELLCMHCPIILSRICTTLGCLMWIKSVRPVVNFQGMWNVDKESWGGAKHYTRQFKTWK